MSLPHFDGESAIARIAERVTDFRQVGGASAFATAMRQFVGGPAAFLLITGRQTNTTPGTLAQIHRCVTTFDVAIAVSHAAAGGRSHQAIALALASKVIAALCPWTPDIPGAEAVQAIRPQGRGRLLDLTADVYWWAEPFEIEYHGRSYAS